MAHLMYDIWVENNRLTYIREATVVLEYAYALSPSNFHIKLLLLKFYHMLGNYTSILHNIVFFRVFFIMIMINLLYNID